MELNLHEKNVLGEGAVYKVIVHRLQKELDGALVSKRMWETSCDALLIKRDEAIKERDAAYAARDQAIKERDAAIAQRSAISKELSLTRKRKAEEIGK